MTKTYVVEITAIVSGTQSQKTYTQEASNYSAAIGNSVRSFIKDTGFRDSEKNSLDVSAKRKV